MKYTLRPRLAIRNVEIEGIDSLIRGDPLNVAGTLEIYNRGASEARISGASCRLFVLERLPMKAPYGAGDQFGVNILLSPSTFSPLPFPSSAINFAEFKGIRTETSWVYVMGELVYFDGLNLRRTFRFCRRFDYGKKRFFAVDDPDYEGDDY